MGSGVNGTRGVPLAFFGLILITGVVVVSCSESSTSILNIWPSFSRSTSTSTSSNSNIRSHSRNRVSEAACEVCHSDELLRLKALYLEHQSKLAYSSPEGHSGLAAASSINTPRIMSISVASDGNIENAVSSGRSQQQRRRSLLQSKGDLSASDLERMLEEKEEDVAKAKLQLKDLKKALSRQVMEVENLDKMLKMSKSDFKASDLTDTREKASKGLKLTDKTQEFIEQCRSNMVTDLTSAENRDWAIYKGYACEATDAELKQYMMYELRGLCPDDWFFVQHLIFVKNCYALPKRRCLSRTPQLFVEPLPRARALFNQRALADGSVRWKYHSCSSYECLNKRTSGDCKSCFNMTLEANRWRVRYRGSLTIREVVEMKGGALRLGLDAGRGTGSFAAHMARYNVTVMTMAMDIEARQGARKGLPYMETIAQRGLIPLHIPHTARLPFFDNTLDLVHCVNSVKYLPLGEFEDLLYEWDRVLRAGGIMWFELFYAPEDEMKVYVQIIELLKYKKLYWEVTKKPVSETKGLPHVYLNALIEKPARIDQPISQAADTSARA